MDAPSEWCWILAIGSLAYTLTDMLSFQRKLKSLKISHLSLELQPCVALRMCTVSVKGGVYKWLMIFELYCLWNYIPSICVPEAKCWMSGCLLPFNISALKNYRRSICSQIWVEFFLYHLVICLVFIHHVYNGLMTWLSSGIDLILLNCPSQMM